ncbi:MAG: SUMF1/EgtB/PvdO family nonheme iron enzyme, partial [Actinomycetota bacterium]|nr:SUMF1/EgtB/PvdO family nonheme iron enzyme [Actinomycetota bacterium]
IAAYEDLWVARRAGGLAPLRAALAGVYDATETPRASRPDAGWLPPAEAREFMEQVRERSLTTLAGADLSPDADPLSANGFVFDLVLEHECQHHETMLQTLALAEPGTFAPRRRALASEGLPAAPGSRWGPAPDMVRVEGGPFLIGAAPEGFAYDNERPRHEIELAAFDIDRTPVTNGAYLEFVALGGYHTRRLWSREGWAWKEAHGVEQPLYWTDDGRVRSFDRTEALDLHLPVMHVSFYEAEAYARFRGKRLPSEAEWEKAACWDPVAAAPRRFPWGEEPPSQDRANLDATAFGPAAAGAYPTGASPCGALGLIGDTWEWTASEFGPYPGFRPFPYAEYSEVFFGRGYKVLRGGSWATCARAVRNSFRNWDLPQRRQIFAGFRCAADG